ncbi:general transcription factor II H, polypeptide 2 (predicted), isoform CRA_a [Rattus norvegicus]|uniref:General transcription factor II H, polypeptide 2 (Predicted), isoform CRA_a n=1 Tax=Rattus norvegicus TaxID=10116 RepID=A6I590_RAT|nr:general transcription factor II H, polypeptide 2 (predicted), isoform CRA_a [Rattus norvegicus]
MRRKKGATSHLGNMLVESPDHQPYTSRVEALGIHIMKRRQCK